MVETAWTTTEEGGVALVAAVVHNDAPVQRRVRIEPTGEGPVWPPRCEGYPEAEWDDGGVVATLAPGARRAVGFATPAAPGDPPVRVETDPAAVGECAGGSASETPAEGESPGAASGDAGAARSPAAVVAALGDPSPPRAAVPRPSVADAAGTEPSEDHVADAAGTGPSEGHAETRTGPEPVRPVDDVGTGEGASATGTATGEGRRGATESSPGDLPPPVRAWLARVESRVETLEAAADAEGVTDAARAAETAGGLAGVEAAVERTPDDVRALRRVARRARRLADRAEGEADAVPLAALRGLA